MKKRFFTLMLALALIVSLAVPAAAAGKVYGWRIKSIVCGCTNTYVVTDDGDLFHWDNYEDRLDPGNVTYLLSGVEQVATSDARYSANMGWSFATLVPPHTIMMMENGDVYGWGYNLLGELGQGRADSTLREFEDAVYIMGGAVKVAANGGASAAITKDGALYCWGTLRAYTVYNKTDPIIWPYPTKVFDNVKDVAIANDMMAVLKADGTVWTIGFQPTGKMDDRELYTFVVDHWEQKLDNVTAIFANEGFRCNTVYAIRTDGSLWGWGDPLLCGLPYDSKRPVQVKPVKIDDNVRTACIAKYNSYYIKNDDTLWVIGNSMESNNNGQMLQPTYAFDKWKDSDGDESPQRYGHPYKARDHVKLVAATSTGVTNSQVAYFVTDEGVVYTNHGSFREGEQDTTPVPAGFAYRQPDFGQELTPPKPSEPTPPENTSTAYASTQKVNVDGSPVEFRMYALKDANGSETNYIRVRDLAAVLSGTEAQFEVGWNGEKGRVELTSKTAYSGSTDKAPFNSAEMACKDLTEPTYVDGSAINMNAIQIDYNGGGYTYYKLRDLGQYLGFNVDWSREKGVYIETDRPYQG